MRAEPEPAAHGGLADGRRHGETRLPGSGLQEGLNPYAPPKASVELAPQAGLWRSGRLVRMDRAGTLPDRCVACNAPSGGYRLRRTLYRSPLLWRLGAFAAPFLALFLGVVGNSELLMAAFWPVAIVAAVAHLFIRRSLKLEFGVCQRHRRLRYALIGFSIACMAGVFVAIFGFRTFPGAPLVLLGSLIALIVLVVVQSYAGIQALALHSLRDEHAWLSGTGEPFRSELPELH